MALVRRSRMEQESRKISKDAPNADRPLRQGTGHDKASGKAGHGRNHPLDSVLDPYYSNVALLAVLLDEVKEALPIGVGGKDGLSVIAALGEGGASNQAKRSRRGLLFLQCIVGFGGEKSHLFSIKMRDGSRKSALR